MELVVIALCSFAVAVAGGVAGLVLGDMRLLILLQFASSPAAGAGANVAVSGLSALTSSIAHWRGRINWRLFWLMAPPSLLGGVLGGLVGLIFGTLRLPAMVKWLGTTPKAAVGTNAATGAVVGLGGQAVFGY